MRIRTQAIIPLTLALAVGLTTALAHAAPPIRYESASQGSSLKVEGTSNVHDWDGTTSEVNGWIEVPGQWSGSGDELRHEPALEGNNATPSLQVRIPVKSLEGNRSGLASNMHEAMKAEEHPRVTFTLTEVRSIDSRGQNAAVWSVVGDLEVAGARERVELELTIRPRSGDRLAIEVEKDLKMTDFDIDPPRAMLGMARAKDDVTVTATWVVQRRTPAPTLPAIDAPAAQRQAMSAVMTAYEEARRAMVARELDEVHAALADLDEPLATLAALDDDAADDATLEQWQQRVQRLEGAVGSVNRAGSINAARASFAVLSHALSQALAEVALAGDRSVLGYFHPGQSGAAGSLWLELERDDLQPRTPYMDQPPRGTPARLHVLYPAAPAANGQE